jgi:sugar lactone lactonase YvrE
MESKMSHRLRSISSAVIAKSMTIALLLLPELACMTAHGEESGPLIEVHRSQEIITGVTTTREGRVFLEYPHLDGSSGTRIGELGKDGVVTAFPNVAWNSWKLGSQTGKAFVRTNSLRVGPDGLLWVVDTGTPSFGAKIIQGGVKLVSIDLNGNQIHRIYPLDDCTLEDSFVDDVRFHGKFAFLTDAGNPALIVLDLTTGQARRVLEKQTSTTAQRPVVASGRVLRTVDGKEVKIHADQLEVSPDGRFLYYQALTGPMYRIETQFLEDPTLSEASLVQKVSFFADTPSTGGTAIAPSGTIYLSDVEHRRILTVSPAGVVKVLLADDRIDWSDAMWIDHDGYLWMPVAQLDKIAPFQGGQSRVRYPIRVYKLRLAAN